LLFKEGGGEVKNKHQCTLNTHLLGKKRKGSLMASLEGGGLETPFHSGTFERGEGGKRGEKEGQGITLLLQKMAASQDKVERGENIKL